MTATRRATDTHITSAGHAQTPEMRNPITMVHGFANALGVVRWMFSVVVLAMSAYTVNGAIITKIKPLAAFLVACVRFQIQTEYYFDIPTPHFPLSLNLILELTFADSEGDRSCLGLVVSHDAIQFTNDPERPQLIHCLSRRHVCCVVRCSRRRVYHDRFHRGLH